MKNIINIYKLILPYLFNTTRVQKATLATLCLIAIDVSATTAFPYIWKNIIAAPQKSTPVYWFILMTTALFAIWTLKKTTPHFKEIAFFPVTNEAIKDIRFKTILKVHKLNLKNLESYNVQEIISATRRVSQSIRNFMRVSFISIFPSTAKLITLSIALIVADWQAGIIVLFAALGLITAAYYLRYYSATKRKGWHLTDNVTVAMGHSLYNTTSIRFILEEESKKLKSLFDLEAEAWQNHNTTVYKLHLFQDIVFYFGAFAGFLLLITSYANGNIELPKLVLIYGLVSSMYSPLLEISRNLTRFFGGMVDIHKTMNILDIPEDKKTLKIESTKQKTISLKGISFKYNDNSQQLKNINLDINPGDKIGIFGPSGTGKSTLCKIIAGLVEPTSGEAFYGNQHLYSINTQSLGKVLCYIPQEQVIKDFETQPHKMGIHLKQKPSSGGEYQRYLLNQALKRKPQILILDETTNALDKVSIDLIMERLLATVPTVIMITHRQNTLLKMNKVFELKDGHLTEIQTNSQKIIGA